MLMRAHADVPEGTELAYAFREGRPNGRQIGPESSGGKWAYGQVRLERGKTYFLTVRRKDGEPFSVARVAANSDAARFQD